MKGPIVTKGYYNNPVADAGSFKDGYFCTGDIGFFKEDRLFIVVRFSSTPLVHSTYNESLSGSQEGAYQV